MSEEEFVDTIMDIDVILLEIESAMHSNNQPMIKRKLQQARSIIANMQESDEKDTGYNIVTKAK